MSCRFCHVNCQFLYNVLTVVKELQSEMFRQHTGCYKAEYLQKTPMVMLSFDEHTVYIMF